MRVPMRSSQTGLSPRVRGNRYGAAIWPGAEGSIPACAGEPVTYLPYASSLRVYPRVCGGTPGDGPQRRSGVGLSPRVRGNR